MNTDDTQASNPLGRTRPRAPGRGRGETLPRIPIGETRPRSALSTADDTPPPPKAPGKRPGWWRWILGMLLYGGMVLTLAGAGGYLSGLKERDAITARQQAQALQEQFDLGVQDLLAGRHEAAMQRFDYILSVDPQFPGALELLEKARAALNQPTLTPSATASPTSQATATPTLDLGSIDGLFAAAQSAQVQGNWTIVIEALVALVAEAPEYRPDEVDQLLYWALRSRGLEKIWAGDQEQGIYDLALAERIFPLDSQADSWRRSASFYLFANSYFGLDWALSTQYFAQICQAGIWDGCFKYARSAWEYADLLFKDEDPCAAAVQYQASLLTIEDAGKAPTATQSFNVCMTATAPSPTPSATATLGTLTASPTVTPTGSISSPSPTMTPTPTLTTPPAGPTDTPTPSPTETETPTPSPTETPTPSPTLTPTEIPASP